MHGLGARVVALLLPIVLVAPAAAAEKVKVTLQKTRLGIPRTPRISERAVTLSEDFLAYDKLVSNEYLPT